MQVYFPLSMNVTLVKSMSKYTSRYNIAICGLNRPCPKCTSIAHPIAVNRGTHYALYCSTCGAYVKHASVEDKRHFYVHRVTVEDKTPVKVCTLYIESERTMIR